MKKFLLLSAVSILLVSCSSKEKLKGDRVSIILSENESSEFKQDSTAVEIDEPIANQDCVQPFYNASHSYAPPKLSYNFKKIWSTRLDFESTPALRTAAAPIVGDGKLFCMDAGGIVYALDVKTGRTVWRKSITIKGKDGQTGGALAYDNGILIANSTFSESVAFTSAGEMLWRIKLPAPAKGDAITIHDGKAFMLCANSSLIVIDVKTGKALWTHSGIISETNYIGSASVAIDGNTVYVAYPSGEIFALLIDNGSVLWESMISKSSLTSTAKTYLHPRACPVVKNDLLYIVAANGQTIALSTRNGEQVWSRDCGSVQTPIVSGNSIICNSESQLICLNRFTGDRRWIIDLDTQAKLVADWYGQLLVEDRIITLSPYGRLSVIDPKDGKIQKTIMVSSDISLNPVVAGETMFIQDNDGRITAYR